MKQSRPGYKEPVISYNAYPPDRRLCIYTVLKEYLFRTKKMRDSSISRLLLSYVKPHKNVTNSRRADSIMASFQLICHVHFLPESDTF